MLSNLRQNSFLILKLFSIIRRYRLDHSRFSNYGNCNCIICIEADKLLKQNPGNKAIKPV